MLGATLYGKEDVRIEEHVRPEPKTGEVLVRVRTATTCGTDLKVFLRGGHARMLTPPTLFGHEGAGEIAAVGQGVEGFREGDRVVWNNSAPCGECEYCRIGDLSLCSNLLFLNGTFAEYVAIPERIVKANLLRIPDALSFDIAAMTEPLACVLHGVAKIGFHEGESGVLLGDGAIGLFFVALARQRGVRLYVVGGSEERLALAERLGAAGTLNRHSGKRDPAAWIADRLDRPLGSDLVVEAVGQPSAWDDALRIVRKGGRVLLFGGCPKDTTVTWPTERLHYDALTLKGVFHNTPRHVREALELLSGPLGDELKSLLAAPAPLESLSDALASMRDRKALKVPVHP